MNYPWEDVITKEMNEREADGVDFVPDWLPGEKPTFEYYCSYSREEWLASNRCYPKTNRKYWKNVNGKKIYIKEEK